MPEQSFLIDLVARALEESAREERGVDWSALLSEQLALIDREEGLAD